MASGTVFYTVPDAFFGGLYMSAHSLWLWAGAPSLVVPFVDFQEHKQADTQTLRAFRKVKI